MAWVRDERVDDAGAPLTDFFEAASKVLQLLRDQLGLRLWMVTRAVDNYQIVLQSADTADSPYEVGPGSVLAWDGSLCAQMVAGNGALIAPRAADVPAYALAENRRHLPIEAYVGVPLRHRDGTLFGTLCGFDPEPQPDALLDAEPLVVLQAELLTTILALELDEEYQRRRAEHAEAEAAQDVLTGVPNRRAWNDVLTTEEARSRRYGHPGSVLMIDLNGLKTVNDTLGHAAGDQLLRDCAAVLTAAARGSDFVARLGGDEFAILAVETDAASARSYTARVREALDAAGIDAAVGLGVRTFPGSLADAQDDADRAMYLDKAAHRDEPDPI